MGFKPRIRLSQAEKRFQNSGTEEKITAATAALRRARIRKIPGIDTPRAIRPISMIDDDTISKALRMLLPAITRDRTVPAERVWMNVIRGTV